MKITIAQLNPIIGDVNGNLRKLKEALKQADQEKADLLVLPELYLVGYPPRDLLEKKWLIERAVQGVEEIKKLSNKYSDTGILFGIPWTNNDYQAGRGLYNSAMLIYQGSVIFKQHKTLLPSYDVFDENRYFDPALKREVFEFKGEKLGISICEDYWNVAEYWQERRYLIDPLEELAEQGATIFINLSASPFHVGKEELRYQMIKKHASKHKIPFLFINQVGANDELIFDGRSMVVNEKGQLTEVLPSFQEKNKTIDLKYESSDNNYKPEEEIMTLNNALVLGIRDYIKKTGFKRVIVGLSGGIDSAVTVALAVQALGPENVLGVTMPGPYSSAGSVNDSILLARNLGIEIKTLPIGDIYQEYLEILSAPFDNCEKDVAEENIQARARGNLLMALSNKFGYLVLSTGNKSELAVGYCTLYGDMSGGLSVISDVPKTLVYKLAKYINRNKPLIPVEIIEKAPSAELRPDQKDEDSLPPYEILDSILYYYVDEGETIKNLVSRGFDADTVKWVVKIVDRNEYKRRQAAPGLRVTTKAFGTGRRMPIAARYEI